MDEWKIVSNCFEDKTISLGSLIGFLVITVISLVLVIMALIHYFKKKNNCEYTIFIYSVISFQCLARSSEISFTLIRYYLQDSDKVSNLGKTLSASFFVIVVALLVHNWSDYVNLVKGRKSSVWVKMIVAALCLLFISGHRVVVDYNIFIDSKLYCDIMGTYLQVVYGCVYTILPMIIIRNYWKVKSYFCKDTKYIVLICTILLVICLFLRGVMNIVDIAISNNSLLLLTTSDSLQVVYEGIPTFLCIPLTFFKPNIFPEIREMVNPIQNDDNLFSLEGVNTPNTQCFISPEELTEINLIGSGSYSDVFISKWNRSVAVKKFKVPYNEVDQEIVDLMLNELSILSSIAHPNLIRFYGYSTSTDDNKNIELKYLNIVTSVCNGGNLRLFMETHIDILDEVLEQFAFKVAIHTARGMSYLHNLDIVHLDLKPENLLVNYDENRFEEYPIQSTNIIITDFGFSMLSNNHFSSNTEVGSPAYNAPELNGSTYDPYKADVFAYGCILFEITTSQVWSEIALDPQFNLQKHLVNNKLKFLIGPCLRMKPLARWSFNEIQRNLNLHVNIFFLDY
eukprot:TRINITY_DN4547_c0_g1_i1.p1 TRINITY_DN4547_c0_g1~~TRINITY_DN4547_c0_g1_i1.p1  ORF type:complete len:567 (+),score=69.45 TRINITY_DN4547_c0_g1_i1:64-1764(+)